MKLHRFLIPALVLGLGACGGSGRASGPDVLAQAAGFEFSAQAAAEILAPQPPFPDQAQAVNAVADLWVQHFLLAKAALEDSTLANIDVGLLVRRQMEGEMVTLLRNQVIQIDTAISDDELRQRYEAALPGGTIRARHILLQFPEGASDTQVDSVRTLAETLRSRILQGESFEELARQYSGDGATAGNGGDLGTFGKNEMVPAFEEAAFALEEGEISEIVETTFGLHLIRVDERIVSGFEERAEQFRAQVQNQMVVEAESAYVASLVADADMQLSSDGIEMVRVLAADSLPDLSPRALGRAVVEYDGGSLTLGEIREWISTSAPTLPRQIQAASDDQITELVFSLTRSELLVNRAKDEGVEVPISRQDSLTSGILTGLKEVAQELGFFDINPMEGETLDAAADRVVRQLLVEIVQGDRDVFPLQSVAFLLEEQYGADVYRSGVQRTMQLIDELRTQTPVAPAPAAESGSPSDTTRQDSAGGQG